ncbi:MAG: hypothetical protein QOH52_2467 [Pseudonocardiales bacterium]|nr:hypothetical protein [Pseudonocardiales bacterium]
MKNSSPHRWWGARIVGAALALGIAGAVIPLTAPAPASAATTGRRTDPVTMSVVSVTPSAPAASTKHIPFTVKLRLTNTTNQPIKKVTIVADRGDPIDTQTGLAAVLARTTPPPTPGLQIKPTHTVTVNLAAGATITTAFATTTSVLDDGTGICICHNAIYPMYLSAHITRSGGADQTLGTVGTFLPSFFQQPTPIDVSWVWPLIDRPHRLVDDTVFTDDELASLVAPDGRLSRALQVVETVESVASARVPLTLVIDPELLDELEVMSTGRYTVRAGSAPAVAGTGQAAATLWLDRLRVVLQNPAVQVDLTPYADPDVESLTKAGLPWDHVLPSTMSRRIALALGSQAPAMDIAWPASGAVSARTLDTMALSGTSTIILNSAAVAPSTQPNGLPASLGTLKAANGSVTAALTSPQLEKYVGATVSLGGAGAAALPQLTAELAVQAAQAPTTPHFALLAPPRYVDPSVDTAVEVIRETSRSRFSQPVALRSAVGGNLPKTASRLRQVPAGAPGLTDQILANASSVTSRLGSVNTLLKDPTNVAESLLTALPQAVQRIESSAWRTDAPNGGRALGIRQAQALSDRVGTILSSVHIIQPKSGTYTLASSNSPLPITVQNELSYPVNVTVQVTTVNDLPGFTATPVTKRISPGSTQLIHIPTKIDRSGRIQVQAQLFTKDGVPLGDPIFLSVHSTVLGVVGVVITVVAGGVLVLALLFRILGRFRKRRSPATESSVPVAAPPARATEPDLDPVAQPARATEPDLDPVAQPETTS